MEIRMIATAWLLQAYPNARKPWSVERQLHAVREAGFDGVTGRATSKVVQAASRAGMTVVGGMDLGRKMDIRPKFSALRDLGVLHVNIQLLDHDTPTEKAVPLAVEAIAQGRAMGLLPLIEIHRDTCTETPEKAYALADGYQKITGEYLPMNFDSSHPAIVKHLVPENYFPRLIDRPWLVRDSTMIHFRPFNGEHCQIPVTDGRGRLSPELRQWLPFCEKVLGVWKQSKKWNIYRVIVPELGPTSAGYGLGCFPDLWQDTLRLKKEILKAWKRA